MAKGITSITYVEHMGNSPTPARVNRKTGALYINLERWKDIQPEHRVFILLHELSHVLLDSSDELLVDQLAFSMYAKMGYSLKESVRALSSVLNGNNPEHYWRVYLQLERAKLYDHTVNGNKDVYHTDFEQLLKSSSMCASNKKCSDCKGCAAGRAFADEIAHQKGDHLSELLGGDPWTDQYEDYEDFTGCQPGERPRQCRKRIRVEGNAQKKVNRTTAQMLKGQAKQTLAEQGISEKALAREARKDGFNSFVKGASKVVKSVKGTDNEDGEGEAPKRKWLIPVIIGGVLLIGGAIAFYFMRKNKLKVS